MDYYPPWVGGDGPPVVVNMGRPGRHRGRLGSEHMIGRQRAYWASPNGDLVVPPPGAAYRSNSVSGPRPQVNIINETTFDETGRRPRSIHYEDYYGRSRSRSHSRSPAPEYDLETRDKLRRLRHLEKKEEEEKLEKELKEKLILEKAKEEVEAKEKKEKEKEMKKKAVEEWQAEERLKKEKEEKEKEKADKEYKERMRRTLWANGYTDEQIEHIMKRGEKKEKIEKGESSGGIVSLSRPTYLRIKRKYLDPQTLDLYQLPWDWDEEDNTYIIVKKWVNERDQEVLFEHTRKLREMKQLTYTTTELRKEHDQLLLVKKREPRKKSPARGWFFT